MLLRYQLQFISKNLGIPGSVALVAELLPQDRQGLTHPIPHPLLDKASVAWKVLLKFAPLLQKVFLATTNLKTLKTMNTEDLERLRT